MTVPRASIDSNCARGSGCRPDIRSRTARSFRYASTGAVVIWSALAAAQEMEPRSYSAVPIGTNFVVVDYARSSGDILFDPSLPVTDLQAKINTYSLGLSHSFGVLGHVASVAIAVPYANANLTGNVEGAPGHAYRSGLGDMRLRRAVNLLVVPHSRRKSSFGAARRPSSVPA